MQPGGLNSLLPSRGSSFCCWVKPSWLTCASRSSASADVSHDPRLGHDRSVCEGAPGLSLFGCPACTEATDPDLPGVSQPPREAAQLTAGLSRRVAEHMQPGVRQGMGHWSGHAVGN